MLRPDLLLRPTNKGLYCPPGDFYLDPVRGAVERAVISHGHSDHARSGHGKVLATPQTLAIMQARYGANFAGERQSLNFGERVTINGVTVWFAPAGHILGSAQIVVEYQGLRIVFTGDYKRRYDPTCQGFEVVDKAHILISEATFGLPVFRHPDTASEIAKLLTSLNHAPDRTHCVGAYSLGKAQRVIAHLRDAGYAAPIYIHSAAQKLCEVYQDTGVDLGPLLLAENDMPDASEMRGKIIVAPSSTFQSEWGQQFPDPIIAFCSGWMGVKRRARSSGVELPLVISDHADWDELTQTIADVNPEETWITYGAADALIRWAELEGRRARPLKQVGMAEDAA